MEVKRHIILIIISRGTRKTTAVEGEVGAEIQVKKTDIDRIVGEGVLRGNQTGNDSLGSILGAVAGDILRAQVKEDHQREDEAIQEVKKEEFPSRRES